jgi:putative DNA primase/helicase
VTLLPHHLALIEESAISEQVARERGYFSVSKPGDLNGRFPKSQRLAPALVVPIHDAWGVQVFCQLRADEPRVIDGRTVKYETPRGSRLTIDVPPAVRPHLGDPRVPLIVTEGARKADSAVSAGLRAVNLLGVSGWKGRNEKGGLTALDDWAMMALNDGRPVYVAFDSDAMTKQSVHQAVSRWGNSLSTVARRCGSSICRTARTEVRRDSTTSWPPATPATTCWRWRAMCCDRCRRTHRPQLCRMYRCSRPASWPP